MTLKLGIATTKSPLHCVVPWRSTDGASDRKCEPEAIVTPNVRSQPRAPTDTCTARCSCARRPGLRC